METPQNAQTRCILFGPKSMTQEDFGVQFFGPNLRIVPKPA